ncbi:MAG TPA: hypothetical protein PK079_05105 [Leptospiraceae bacterium]|nr:hypothetical protein [Leptospiraceae bacterium]HMW06249.1 hypothetical protein [Leptospiraceae bacterium]HMX35256.1 hypothetical protein [Leptospiraceae bacterium]HMY31711.1 hypothetical protein [Leptospiraceae bacterium]HMZ65776.1 hypothetical protein [Leptospiraceae bacterium]
MKIFGDFPILPILLGLFFILYVIYSWFDHFKSGRFKRIEKEESIKPRLKNGLEPTATDLNLDVSEKILNHDFNSSDSE